MTKNDSPDKKDKNKKKLNSENDHKRGYPPRYAVVTKESVKLYNPDSYTTRKRIIGI